MTSWFEDFWIPPQGLIWWSFGPQGGKPWTVGKLLLGYVNVFDVEPQSASCEKRWQRQPHGAEHCKKLVSAILGLQDRLI